MRKYILLTWVKYLKYILQNMFVKKINADFYLLYDLFISLIEGRE